MKTYIYIYTTTHETIDDSHSMVNKASLSITAENIGFSRIKTIVGSRSMRLCSVYCMNSKGQVATWRLTPRLSFAEVQDDLIALRDRLLSQGKVLKEFYIDNCCSWRKKLQAVFGDHLVVYRDIFHAVKRVSDKIPKHHPLRCECMREWQVVFHDPSDLGEKRHCPSPSPLIIEKNLDKFVERWKDAEHDG